MSQCPHRSSPWLKEAAREDMLSGPAGAVRTEKMGKVVFCVIEKSDTFTPKGTEQKQRFGPAASIQSGNLSEWSNLSLRDKQPATTMQ